MTIRYQAGKSWKRLRQRLEAAAFILCTVVPVLLRAADAGSASQRLYPEATLSLASFASPSAIPESAFEPPIADSSDVARTNVSIPPFPSPVAPETFPASPSSNSLPVNLVDFLDTTNTLSRLDMSEREFLAQVQHRLEVARYLRNSRQAREAEPILIGLLAEHTPEDIQQAALLELAAAAQDQNNVTRAQQIYAQFLTKWSQDLRVPEILLRQGLLFRQMGLYNLALTKFYGVMTSALVLKNDQLDYYVRLVNRAQTQIAETHYELGKYLEAADFFSRLLKQNSANIDKSQVLYKLTRCNAALGKNAEAVSNAQDFLIRYPDAPEQPEIRFHLAVALKQIGRDNESLQQVLLLLQEQKERTKDRPEVWAYWQQRAGNLIANQLYREGDYPRALEIYLNLSQLDTSLTWQVPLNYQIGITYERLWQPQKATEIYNEILIHEKEFGTTMSPGLKTVFDMARWRINFIRWQGKAEAANQEIRSAVTNRTTTASLPTRSALSP